MPMKPKANVTNRAGELVPSRKAPGASTTSARARGMRHYGNPEHMRAAIRLDLEDRQAGHTQAGRYTRVVDAIVKEFRCSDASGRRAIAAVRAYNAALLEDRQPTLIAELVEQHQDIAEKATSLGDFAPAVAALREIGKLTGVYAPKKLEVSGSVNHTHSMAALPEMDALLAVLSPQGKAALELFLQEWEEAMRTGRLALPEPEAELDDDDVEDADVVDDDAEPSEAN